MAEEGWMNSVFPAAKHSIFGLRVSHRAHCFLCAIELGNYRSSPYLGSVHTLTAFPSAPSLGKRPINVLLSGYKPSAHVRDLDFRLPALLIPDSIPPNPNLYLTYVGIQGKWCFIVLVGMPSCAL